jgi:hypothetical protein
MAFDLKSEIYAQINKTNDETMRTVLLLLLGVLEANLDGIEGIQKSIQNLRDDEESLRRAVLNGHEAAHHDHHEWVAKKIADEKKAEEDAQEIAKAGKKAAVEQAARMVVTALLSGSAGVVAALWLMAPK